MPFLQINDRQFPLRSGEMTLGGGSADIPVAGVDAVVARLQLTDDQQAAIRRVHPTAPLTINGVALGTEPSPLIHGDKIQAGTVEILYGDDKKQAGGTQVISNLSIPADLLRKSRTAPSKPTAATGGRLVSLVDGREFHVKSTGLTLGRDAACDVVLPGSDISRNHAEIAVSPEGYYVIDLSTNGVFVNGDKIEGTRTLGRGDVIRIGNEEFRFYADVPAPSAPAPAAPAPAAAPPAPPRVSRPAAAMGPGGLPARGEPTAPPQAAYVPGAPRPAIAQLEIINEGPSKGRKFDLFTPLSHVGRGAHNDVVIAEDSVSDTHAKIQRREQGWFIIDLGSTNGTYVGGRRITGEAALVGAPDVRFGGVKVIFRPAAGADSAAKGTRAIAGVTPDQARRMSTAAAKESATEEAGAKPRTGVPPAVWIAVAVVVVAALAYILLGR